MIANADASIGMELLHQINELYVTLHGFAIASFCLELNKQCSKIQFKNLNLYARSNQHEGPLGPEIKFISLKYKF